MFAPYLRLLPVALLALGCRRATPPAAPDPLVGLPIESGAIDWSRPIPPTPAGGVAEPGYVGALACQPCHKKLFASWARHAMASTGLRPLASLDAAWLAKIFDAGASASVVQPRSGMRYRPVRKEGRYFVEELRLGDDGKPVHSWLVPLTHALSAGAYGMAFYFRKGERFYQIPIDYYAKLGRWDLDPGFSAGNRRFGRPLDVFCISCHADYPRRSASSGELFFEPMPAGIGCERCHGPGARHLQTLRREDIVNPARLSPLRQLDVCTQCHLQERSAARLGRHEFSYRPGEPLDQFRVSFVAATAEPDRFYLLAHSDRMVRSACWRGSGKKLTCTSCHDPHVSSLDEPAAYWDEKCAACHREKRCSAPPAEQAKEGGHCPRCHMRAGPTSMLPLVSVTDHFIQRRPPPVKPGPEQKTAQLESWSALVGEPVAGPELPALEALALADEGERAEAARRIAALPARPALPKLYHWLTLQLDQLRQPARALEALAQLVRIEPDSADTLVEYARRREGDPAEAQRALDRALALDPGHPGALEAEGVALLRGGRTEEARAKLERAAAESEMAGVAHVGLAALALRAGRREAALAELEAARRVSPGDAWILEKLAAAYGEAGDTSHAAEIEHARAHFAAKEGRHLSDATQWLPPTWR